MAETCFDCKIGENFKIYFRYSLRFIDTSRFHFEISWLDASRQLPNFGLGYFETHVWTPQDYFFWTLRDYFSLEMTKVNRPLYRIFGQSCTFYVRVYTHYTLIHSYINHLTIQLKIINWIYSIVTVQLAAKKCLLSKWGVLIFLDRI